MSAASDSLYYPRRTGLHRGYAVVRSFTRFARNQPLAFVSLLVFVVVALAALFAPWVAPYDPLRPAPVDRLQGPSADHWFGTDDLGRDVFSRVIYGSRVSMIVGIVTVAVGVGAGIVIGISSAYVGGMFDAIVQRILDSVMSIPGLILAIAISGVLGAGTLNSIVPIAILIIPINARVVRSSVLSIKERQFIEAATVIGASDRRIMARHVFPNTLAPVFVLASIWLGNAIIIEASLSFLGLGTPPPNPSWGNMLSGAGRAYLERAPWLAIFPGLAITVVVLAMNLLGDGLRDALDPRLRGER
jgi:peptide/nickel transport system permease protein